MILLDHHSIFKRINYIVIHPSMWYIVYSFRFVFVGSFVTSCHLICLLSHENIEKYVCYGLIVGPVVHSSYKSA